MPLDVDDADALRAQLDRQAADKRAHFEHRRRVTAAEARALRELRTELVPTGRLCRDLFGVVEQYVGRRADLVEATRVAEYNDRLHRATCAAYQAAYACVAKAETLNTEEHRIYKRYGSPLYVWDAGERVDSSGVGPSGYEYGPEEGVTMREALYRLFADAGSSRQLEYAPAYDDEPLPGDRMSEDETGTPHVGHPEGLAAASESESE